mmetsp:Transcript_34748/g.98491  ORF Transcript_34748/g.98491 Transcript_34748/m.98491 type:complete len:198 (+) Transcript_34748:637-1230(+)
MLQFLTVAMRCVRTRWFPPQLLPGISKDASSSPGTAQNAPGADGRQQCDRSQPGGHQAQEDPWQWWHQFWQEVQKPFQNYDNENNEHTEPDHSGRQDVPARAAGAPYLEIPPQAQVLVSDGNNDNVVFPDHPDENSENSYDQPENPGTERKRKRLWNSFFLGRKKHEKPPNPSPKNIQNILKKTWVAPLDHLLPTLL